MITADLKTEVLTASSELLTIHELIRDYLGLAEGAQRLEAKAERLGSMPPAVERMYKLIVLAKQNVELKILEGIKHVFESHLTNVMDIIAES